VFQRYVACVSYECLKSRADVAHIAMVVHVCYKCLFQLFHLFQTYAASVFIWMLYIFHTYVESVLSCMLYMFCNDFLKCFHVFLQLLRMLQKFRLK
jgi:hypothetical protein